MEQINPIIKADFPDPDVILVAVLGISAVYAYKKMQEYKNI